MDYIKEIDAFMEIVPVKQLTSGQINLWFALMFCRETCKDHEWISIRDETLQLRTGLSKRKLHQSRESLKKEGLIDYKNVGIATKYKVVSLTQTE